MQDGNKEKTEKLDAFAARLSQLAGRARLKQVELARLLSVKPQRVGSWFQGKNFPGGEIEHALAALLGTTRDWLIEGLEKQENTYSADFSVAEISRSMARQPLEAKARQLLEEAISLAAQDPARLGWLVEQLRLHLRPPGHWVSSSSAASTSTAAKSDVLRDLRFDQLKREAGQTDFAKNGPITGQPPDQETGQRPAVSN